MLKATNLTHEYTGGSQLSFPDIDIKEKEHWLITGQSGSGKTTLLHALSGLLKPSQGKITFNDKVLTSENQRNLDAIRKDQIGFIFQDNHLIPSLSILGNLKLTGETEETILQKLGSFDLSSKANQKPHQLSRGEQQRICILRGLIGSPKIIFADEPTSSLDDKNAELVLRLLKEESAETGAALVVVSHDNRIKSNFENTITL